MKNVERDLQNLKNIVVQQAEITRLLAEAVVKLVEVVEEIKPEEAGSNSKVLALASDTKHLVDAVRKTNPQHQVNVIRDKYGYR